MSGAAQVEIVAEEEAAGGWQFVAHALDETGQLSKFRISLSWADYNHWSSSGADDPATVASAVLQFLLSRHAPNDLRPSFDAAISRRMHADADERIPAYIPDRL